MSFALSTRDALDDILADARRDSVEFPYLLANHVPMVLVALSRLGASDARVAEYLANYRRVKGLVPIPPRVAPIERARWTEALGDRSREADYRDFFVAEVRRLGVNDAIATYLPTLLPGIGASALHGLMRLAYGVLRMDPDEVGTALGYWATTYLRMPEATGAAPITDDPAAVLAQSAAIEGMHHLEPETDLLWHTIRAAGAEPGFAPVVDMLAIKSDCLKRLAATSLVVFATAMDFTSLHAVTGTHWVRLVTPHLPEEERPRLIRYYWQIIASLVPKIGFPTIPEAETIEAWRNLDAPEWPEIEAKAIQSDDEHDISLTFSAREEQKIYGDRLYRVVAARRVGLIA
ncbi:MAG: questin oxidase family protein [Rhizobiales bacterium]|nr:questin oxidase family protein [Hyphomicrobiales bacterium]